MMLGYARVSTTDQSLDLQRDQLRAVGCEQLFIDTLSGAKADRPGLAAAIAYARPGDALVVWKLDRLGGSLQHLIATVAELHARGVGFRSLTEGFDTTSPGGTLIFHVFGALAEFERALIRERTQAGLAAARARGRQGGRPPKLTPKKAQMAQQLHHAGTGITEICATLGIGRTTLYRYLALQQNG